MIPLPQKTKIVESTQNRGVFVIEGLYPGYGVTMGNSLRRVLLSSLEGAAVTQVKIKGVEHEFSTLPGVLEDVVMILLNLKQMRFRLYGEEPQIATLKIKGEKDIKASDFKFPDSLELANADLDIAHLTEKSAELEMEIQIENGIGYVPTEERKKEKQEIGSIALDAIFTPVRRVSSRVENMRVGERTDFNRLTLEIETDSTITPEEAFYQAANILVRQLEAIESGVKEVAEAHSLAAAQAKEPKETKGTSVKKVKKAAVSKVKKKKAEK